jgi:hypothetical protein
MLATIECRRIRNAVPVTELVSIDFQAAGQGLPVLTIHQKFRPRLGRYAETDVYRVEEIPTGMGGRAFLLHRSEQAIAADGGDVSYGVLIGNPQDTQCECRGFQAHGKCKHLDALAYLLARGHIDRPGEEGTGLEECWVPLASPQGDCPF